MGTNTNILYRMAKQKRKAERLCLNQTTNKFTYYASVRPYIFLVDFKNLYSYICLAVKVHLKI